MVERPIDVVVLVGGRSAEHEVSLASGHSVLQHLDPDRWRAWPVLIGRDGRWHLPDLDAPMAVREFPLSVADSGRMPAAGLAHLLEALGSFVVFPALHGVDGEDGRLQGMLELHGLPFVGSGCAASAVGMDKVRTRECLAAHGVPLPHGVHGTMPGVDPRSAAAEAARVVAEVGLPCFLKVDLSGSSFGVRRIDDEAAARSFFLEESGIGRYVAESRVLGTEISVPVLERPTDGQLEALTPVGIHPAEEQGFFSTAAKYQPGLCDEVVPPRGLPGEVLEVARRLALRCHAALGCRGVSRTDMIVTTDGPVVLEVNTLPGLTPASLLPKSAAHVGIDFPRLLDRLLDAALRRSGTG